MSNIELLVQATLHTIKFQRELKKPAAIDVWVKPDNHSKFLELLVKELIKYLNLEESYFMFDEPCKRLNRINVDFFGYDSVNVIKMSLRSPVLTVTTKEQTHTLIDTGILQ